MRPAVFVNMLAVTAAERSVSLDLLFSHVDWWGKKKKKSKPTRNKDGCRARSERKTACQILKR